ncbi:hypothetical protein [Streptomyces odontomachi]|uniref:hypothetical protein n=1 Tax=Streptomyces odontomachi TaxID=2944940 RepID=UPI00210AA1BD|nr:hypothetical protein [Streptomyces sp. ODS25]
MTASAPSPRLKSLPELPTGPRLAEPALATASGGAPKDVARQGVPSAVPDQQPGDGRAPIAWLTVTAPGRGITPTARSWCLCGRDQFAAGRRKVLDLIADHTAHRDACPRRTTQEGRTAA